MIIKNLYILNDREDFINMFLKELCKENISFIYIKETNELHFNNYIIRFISIEKYSKQIIYENIFNLLTDNNFYSNIDLFDISDNNIEYNKYLLNLKQENINTNIKFKNQINNNKISKKQLNPTRKIYKR